MEIQRLIDSLKMKTDLEWFDAFCEILVKTNDLEAKCLICLLGYIDNNLDNEVRGSALLVPHDSRFLKIYINPMPSDENQKIDFLAFIGNNFELKISDIAKRFPTYKIAYNSYDDINQLFFYHINERFEFSALSVFINEDIDTIDVKTMIKVTKINFWFGDNMVKARSGFSMKR